MAQTDRQTDKASHWKSAIFDVDDSWAKLDTLPPFVKRLHRQKEICPTTQKPHFQVHVECNRQVRLTQLTAWIKATKWIPVLGQQHIANSIKYCSKTESAVEGTHEVLEGEKYLQMHELLLNVAKMVWHMSMDGDGMEWNVVTSRLVELDLKWANKLCNPAIKKAWETWGGVFVSRVAEWSEESGGAYIIEGTTHEEETNPIECLID